MEGTPFRLTFGVELEFIVRYDPEIYKDYLLAMKANPRDNPRLEYGILVSKEMIKLLNENGFPTNSHTCIDFSKWTVETDDSICPDDYRPNWYGIELKTPALVWSRTALEQVERVVNLLVSKFELHVNDSCGLHVHVGNEDRGFSMRTLKNFCSLITVFEPQLDSLHAPDRLQNQYAKSTSGVFSTKALLREKLSIIDRLKTIDDLILRFNSRGRRHLQTKCMAFNFSNLQKVYSEPLWTIEFRQHRGTLHPASIVNWVMVACNLVQMSNDSEGFRDLIEKHINNAKYTIIDLFNDLGLFDLAKFYAPRVFPSDSE